METPPATHDPPGLSPEQVQEAGVEVCLWMLAIGQSPIL